MLHRLHLCLPPNPSSLLPEKERQLSCLMELLSSLLTTAYLHIITLMLLNGAPALLTDVPVYLFGRNGFKQPLGYVVQIRLLSANKVHLSTGRLKVVYSACF